MRLSAALSSGTAALHLALRILVIRPGDEVICSTLTFRANANPILYEGAHPIFVDCDPATWNIDPDLLRKALKDSAARGQLPRAAITIDLCGRCADYDRILDARAECNVPVIEDAAEGFGDLPRGKSRRFREVRFLSLQWKQD